MKRTGDGMERRGGVMEMLSGAMRWRSDGRAGMRSEKLGHSMVMSSGGIAM